MELALLLQVEANKAELHSRPQQIHLLALAIHFQAGIQQQMEQVELRSLKMHQTLCPFRPQTLFFMRSGLPIQTIQLCMTIKVQQQHKVVDRPHIQLLLPLQQFQLPLQSKQDTHLMAGLLRQLAEPK
jgi:hypothetical protein